MKAARKATTFKTAITDIGVVKRLLKLRKGVNVFSQGARADAIFLVQTGKVQVTVTSTYGKETVLRVLGPDDFIGEECLLSGSLRTSTATSLGPSTVFRIEKRAMLQVLQIHPEFSYRFVASLLARSVNLKENLCEQLFNHGETRLACVLLKLVRIGHHPPRLSSTIGLRVTHVVLAEMVGTNRSRITSLMNKFRKMGVINYEGSGDITVMTELLTDLVLASR